MKNWLNLREHRIKEKKSKKHTHEHNKKSTEEKVASVYLPGLRMWSLNGLSAASHIALHRNTAPSALHCSFRWSARFVYMPPTHTGQVKSQEKFPIHVYGKPFSIWRKSKNLLCNLFGARSTPASSQIIQWMSSLHTYILFYVCLYGERTADGQTCQHQTVSVAWRGSEEKHMNSIMNRHTQTLRCCCCCCTVCAEISWMPLLAACRHIPCAIVYAC